MFGINSKCRPFHEAHPTTSMFLETIITRSRNIHSSYSTSKITSSLVVKFSKHHQEQIFTSAANKYNHNDRCFKNRLWGHVGKHFIQGTWSEFQQKQHINYLELEAVFLTLKHFLSVLKNHNVLIRCNNTTVVQYINKQGGTKSLHLCFRTWDLWNFAIENNIQIKAAHTLGIKNKLADQLSRNRKVATEWTLHRPIVDQIFHLLGHPLIDLFASIQNRQAQIFCSWIPHPQALALDALTISWEGMFAYAYPPICLIPKVLQHMSQFHCQIILIAPKWPRRHWYTDLLQLLMDCLRKLLPLPNPLHQPNTAINHQTQKFSVCMLGFYRRKLPRERLF